MMKWEACRTKKYERNIYLKLRWLWKLKVLNEENKCILIEPEIYCEKQKFKHIAVDMK